MTPATIDARLLYWTLLPAGTDDLDDQQARYRFERVLPVPVDGLHLVRARLPAGGSVLVGIESDRLRTHLAQRGDVTADTWTLLPDRLPDHLAATVPADVLAGLNLLHGDFEPDRRRRVRRLRDRVVAACLATTLLLALIGIERRVADQAQAAEAMRRAGRELLSQAVGANHGAVPPAALLTQELRRLEQGARGPTALDSGAILQRLWSAWPADLRAQVETVSLASDRLVVRGTVPTLAEAGVLARACPVIQVDGATLQAAPLQAEQTPRGAAFLLTWHVQGAVRTGGQP